MITNRNVAFYAPLKEPDHPSPSGDRLMARQLIAALQQMGADVRVMSRLRTHSAVPDAATLDSMRQASQHERQRILAEARLDGWRPDLWFTYHPYYKAPDWLGPALARDFGIPYVAAEASYAKKRASDAWAAWQDEAMQALCAASVLFCFSERDRSGLLDCPGLSARLVDLKPFLQDLGSHRPDQRDHHALPHKPIRLVTAAMMHPGDKFESYSLLAEALGQIASLDWSLQILGDGAMRQEVEKLFAVLPAGKVNFAGLATQHEVKQAFLASDIFVWPGLGEAYGMVYLEAQAQGLPPVALLTAGVPEVIKDGVTGLLVKPEVSVSQTALAYGEAIAGLMADSRRRQALGLAATTFVHQERTEAVAMASLAEGLSDALQNHPRDNKQDRA